jgi:molecular chaperone HtpG
MSERFGELALLLYEQAVLAEGRALDDPAAFIRRVNRLLTTNAA